MKRDFELFCIQNLKHCYLIFAFNYITLNMKYDRTHNGILYYQVIFGILNNMVFRIGCLMLDMMTFAKINHHNILNLMYIIYARAP